MPPQQTPTPTQAPVSISPLIGSPNSMGPSINPTSSLLVSQLLAGSASSLVDPGAAATPFGMIVVGDGTVQNEIVKKKNEDAAATRRDSIIELEETHDLRDISEMMESGGMAFPTVPGYEDLRPVYSIVGFSPAFCDRFCPRTWFYRCFSIVLPFVLMAVAWFWLVAANRGLCYRLESYSSL